MTSWPLTGRPMSRELPARSAKPLIASHPSCASPELGRIFADLDGVEQLAQPLRAIREPAAPLPDAPATTQGSRFTILQPHSEGGLGRVHLARDEQCGGPWR